MFGDAHSDVLRCYKSIMDLQFWDLKVVISEFIENINPVQEDQSRFYYTLQFLQFSPSFGFCHFYYSYKTQLSFFGCFYFPFHDSSMSSISFCIIVYTPFCILVEFELSCLAIELLLLQKKSFDR